MEKVTAMVDASEEVVLAREVEESILPGFRFHPTDEELIGFYLRRKVEKKAIAKDIIKQVDIYKYDPWDLPRISNVGDKEWYFFCLRGRKYKNSIRPNRVTGSGFWKATGIDRPVFSTSKGNDCVGLKKSLVYYRGSAGKGTKTDWMMHEFRLPADGTPSKSSNVNNGCTQDSETWTICRIFRRTIPHKKHMPSRHVSSDSNPKTSSAESRGSDITYVEDTESNHSVITYLEGTKPYNSVIDYLEGQSHLYAGQWNSPAQEAPPVATYPNFYSSSTGDFMFDEGCWDELERIVEFSMDPSLAHECKYTQSPSF